jgi:hypothetical protein
MFELDHATHFAARMIRRCGYSLIADGAAAVFSRDDCDT